MHSPFPGMDPYLEGYLWPDVHHNLASAIQELLARQVSPKYVARVSLYTVEDTSPEEEVGIMYPDVEVLKRPREAQEAAVPANGGKKAFTPASLTISTPHPIEVNIPVVEIKDRAKNTLITSIEILSPVNKRQPGLAPYREKRSRLRRSGVHFLEIDLLRRGQRTLEYPYLPKSHYMVSLARAEEERISIWAFDIKDALPVLPVPLKKPDEDAQLDLREALDKIYERNLYHLSTNYEEPPPAPPLTEAEQAWMRNLLDGFLSREGQTE